MCKNDFLATLTALTLLRFLPQEWKLFIRNYNKTLTVFSDEGFL